MFSLRTNRLPELIRFFLIPVIVNNAMGIETEIIGNEPLPTEADWPAGTERVVNSPDRLYARRINEEDVFYFGGDTQAFNKALQAFSAMQISTHQLIIKAGPGEIKSFEGKRVRYDWCLYVDTERGMATQREKESSEENCPILDCRIHNIDLESIVLPENIIITLAEEHRERHWMAQQIKELTKWSSAKQKWAKYAESFITEQRNRVRLTWPEGTEPPIGGYVEFQSPRVEKYLPQHKIYLIETSLIGVSKLFAVTEKGHISNLSGCGCSSIDGKSPFRNELFSDFIKQQQIKVTDANSAVEIGKFVEELSFAPQRWMGIRLNTKDFRIFKTWIFSHSNAVDSPDWQWYAEKGAGGWIVSRRYTGPPASTIMPPRWRLSLDQQDRIIEVTH